MLMWKVQDVDVDARYEGVCGDNMCWKTNMPMRMFLPVDFALKKM